MAAEVNEFIPNVNEKPRVTIKSDKFKTEFTVLPALGGFGMYEVKASGGKLPQELMGRFTRMDWAVKAVLKYEYAHPGTLAVQRDKKAEIRNAAKVQRERTEHLREGADN